MTCRPTFFVHTGEYNTLIEWLSTSLIPNSEARLNKMNISEGMISKYVERPLYTKLSFISTGEVDLDVFGDEKINEYLQKRNQEFLDRCNCDWTRVKDLLLGIYDLADLMSRPILLSMIVDTILEGKIDPKNEIQIAGPTALYEIYTGLQFERDVYKGEARRFLDPNQRRYFAQATAVAMLKKHELVVTYTDILRVIDESEDIAVKASPLPRRANQEQIATDIVVCTFLSKQNEGGFRFVHKSFMEFFVAQFLKEAIEKDTQPAIMQIALPKEILLFLANYTSVEVAFPQKLRAMFSSLRLVSQKAQIILRNVGAAILMSTVELPGCMFRGQMFSELLFSGVRWTDHTFDAVTIDRTEIEDLLVNKCALLSSVISNCEISRTSFARCDIRATIRTTRIMECKFMEASLELNLESVILRGVTISKCSAKIGGDALFHSSRITETRIQAAEGRCILRYQNCRFDHCVLIDESRVIRRGLSIFESDISDCFLLGVSLDARDFAKPEAVAKLKRNRGVIVVFPSLSDESPVSSGFECSLLTDQLVLITAEISFSRADLRDALRAVDVTWASESERTPFERYVHVPDSP